MKKCARSYRALSEALEGRVLLSLNVLTHHGNYYNDGANLAETVLTPTSVNSTNFGKQFSIGLDGGIISAEPLYLQNVNITTGSSAGVHSVVIAGTLTDGLYALDANTGTILWHDNFTNVSDPTNLTATSGVGPIVASDIAGNTDVGNYIGILATPAVDLNTNEVFVATNTREVRGADTHFVQRLWAINLSNGAPTKAPTVIGDTIANTGILGNFTYVSGPIVNGTGNNNPADPNNPTYPNTDRWLSAPGGKSGSVIAFNAILQMERPAVTLVGNTLYLAFASHGDDGPYYGWVLGYRETDLALVAAFNDVPTFGTNVASSQPYIAEAGFWMSGSNIANDGTNLFLLSGNGNFNGDPSNFDASGFPIDHNYGDSLIKLVVDPSSSSNSQNGNGWGLKVADFFTPSNQYELNKLDIDLGSGGVTLLPDSLHDAAGNPMLVIGGKESRIYLIDRNNLGKFNSSYPQTSTTVDPRLYDRVIGEFPNNGLDTANQQIYSSAAYYNGNFYMAIRGSQGVEFNASTFASGTTPPGNTYIPTATRTAFTFGYPGATFQISANGNTNGVLWALDKGTNQLLAWDASNIINPIYQSTTNAADAITGGSVKFSLPTIASGMVYVGSNGSNLIGYGLNLSYLNSVSSFFSPPTTLAASYSNSTNVHLSWVSHASLATEYRIDRSIDGTNWSAVAYVPGAQTVYDDGTVTTNTSYQYRVVGINGVNSTAASNIATAPTMLTLTGQNLYLKLDSNGQSLDIWNDNTGFGGVMQSVLLSQLSSVTVNASGATSSVTVSFAAGDPLPSGGLTFVGGSGFDTLRIVGNDTGTNLSLNSTTATVSGGFGSVPITYAGANAIVFVAGNGADALTQAAVPGGSAAVSMQNFSSSDSISVNVGSMTIPMPTSGGTVPTASLGSLTLGSTAQASLSPATGSASRALLVLGSLSLAGSASNWLSKFDLAGNDLVVHSTPFATLQNEVTQGANLPSVNNWNGSGIADALAASDALQLTGLGTILNNNGSGQTVFNAGAPFDGYAPSLTDVLVKHTFYGDANLSGNVDGTDYSLIDSGFSTPNSTGWAKGDFSYDNKVDGSDYSLIDNDFNIQDALNPASIAVTPTLLANNVLVSLRTAFGTAAKAGSGGVLINLLTTSSGGTFFVGGNPVTTVTILSGASSTTVQYQDTVFGTPILTFSSAGLRPVNVTWMLNASSVGTATQLGFNTTPLNVAVGNSSNSVTVTLQDGAGNLINAGTGGVIVNLSSSSATGIFKKSGSTVTSVMIPAGSASVSFTYVDTVAGVPNITASASGLGSALQQETIFASPTNIGFANVPLQMIVGTAPGIVTVQLLDQVGNPIIAGAGGMTVNLSSSSAGGTFYNSSNVVVTSVVIPAGASSVVVAYRDTNTGSPTLTISASGFANKTQVEQVAALPTGTVAYYSFGNSAGFLNDASGTGNTLKVGAGSVVFSSTGLPVGFTGAASFSSNGYLTTNSGAFPISVPTGNSNYTISAWININSGTNKNGIVGWGNYGTTGQVNAFRTTQGDSAPDGAGLNNYWWANDYIQPTVNLVGTWVNVGVTYNGTVRTIYVNGVALGSQNSGADNSTAQNFRIGSTNLGEFFNGKMANLLIANTAFTPTQMLSLYNGT